MPNASDNTIDLFDYNIGIKEEDKETCPYVEVKPYVNNSDYVANPAGYYKNAKTDSDSNPSYDELYAGLYTAGNPIGTIIFPYFNDKPFSYTSEYTPINSEDSPGMWMQKAGFSGGKGFLYGAEDVIANLGGALEASWLRHITPSESMMSVGESHRMNKRQSAQSIKAFARGTGAEYGTKFTMFNETVDDIEKNHKFIINFLKLLAPTYPNVMMMKVPCLFDINIPSIVRFKHGFIGNFTAAPSGTSKMIDGIIAPNAWIISMSFNSLTPVSTQSLDLIQPGDRGFQSGTNEPPPEGYDLPATRYSPADTMTA